MYFSVMLKCALIAINLLQKDYCICVAGDVTHCLFLAWWKERQKMSIPIQLILKNYKNPFNKSFAELCQYFLTQMGYKAIFNIKLDIESGYKARTPANIASTLVIMNVLPYILFLFLWWGDTSLFHRIYSAILLVK